VRPTDCIEVRGLRVTGVHGVLPEERLRPQPFSVDLDVYLDSGRAAHSDDLADTADYAALIVAAAAVVANDQYALLESLAGRVAEVVLAADDRIAEVRATVRKLRPPVPVDLASVGVSVVRRRGDA
jgi:dihydroneopterin aldolase